MSRGVVLVRSDEPEVQLQALRTTLSLSLGDRQADLLIAPAALGILAPGHGAEAEHVLQTVRQVGLGVELDADGVHSLVHHAGEVLPHAEFVDRLATAEFVQVF